MIDNTVVTIKAGNGGNGCVSCLTSRRIAKGGPDGGNGGNGGNVIFIGDSNERTLEYYQYSPKIKADTGVHGASQNMHGKTGQDSICKLPLGTQIWNEDETELLIDITEEGQTFLAATGGLGGFGNNHFKNPSNQTPDYAKPGEVTHEFKLTLRLKLIADVGIIGMPNAGKSSFLRAISNSKTKVADYPFTTLKPELGTITYHSKKIVFADIPGLIENAHLGKGLGYYFLSHVERCEILLHLIDSSQENPFQTYLTVRHELEMYADILIDKMEIIILTKKDLLSETEAHNIFKLFQDQVNAHSNKRRQIFFISNYDLQLSHELFGLIFKQIYINTSS